MKWTEYDPATGRIRQAIEGEQVVQPATSPTLGILDDVAGDGSVAYVDTAAGQLVARPDCSIAVDQEGSVITLENVNVGTVVTVSGDMSESITQDHDDGKVELDFTGAPGTYILAAEQFPELPFSTAVTIT